MLQPPLPKDLPAFFIYRHCLTMVVLHPSVKSKELPMKNYSSFITSETDVSTKHMTPHIVCSQCVTRSPQLSLMTWKVLGITASVISDLLATSIFWEMMQNQKHQPHNGITPLVNCLLNPSSHHSVFSVTKWRSKVLIAKLRVENFSSYKNKYNAWEQIETRAEKLGLVRLHRQVKDKDLFACEAKHHPSCFKSFRTAFANYELKIHKAKGSKDTDYACMSAAHEKALSLVLEHIQTHVVQQNEVLQLSSLRLLYVEELKQHGYEKANYRSEKLLKRLQNDPIKDDVSFMKVNRDKGDAISFWFVYNSKTTVSNALARAYTLGSADKYQDVALLLRHNILQAFSLSKGLPWPPTADDMELSCEKLLPPDLVRFLSIVMVGKEDLEMSEKMKRLVFSIGQDLCRAVSEGKWKLPKHMLLCMTVRHLFRSKQLTTILHRLGHSESYDFGLELETALAKALDEVSTYLTPQIVTGKGNIVFIVSGTTSIKPQQVCTAATLSTVLEESWCRKSGLGLRPPRSERCRSSTSHNSVA